MTMHDLLDRKLLTALCAASALTACSQRGSYMAAEYAAAPAPARADYQAGETYEVNPENDFVDTEAEDTSTFSIDVDNASYTLMRRDVRSGRLPAAEAVRPEEYINYFDYGYEQPDGAHPFSIDLEVAPSAFGEGKHLMRVGIQGEARSVEELKPTNIVLLVDVSGSMKSEEKLPLVVQSVEALIDNLRPEDTVSIVTYAGADRVLLEPTPVRRAGKIRRAINSVDDWFMGGSTNAEAGIVTAYKLAEQAKKEGGNNRVIILTDGDFNVGKTGEELFELIDSYRVKGISLTAMGYGRGNYHDRHMENIAKRGNGNYFYVDTLAEAERVFGADLPSTLEVIAADVKIQVQFDPAVVRSYRLVGYENRVMNNEDFRDDTKDAGEIGPGHTVTAYYELELHPNPEVVGQLAEVRVRYKSQYGEASKEITHAVTTDRIAASFEQASPGFQFGAAVAEYAELLRRSKHVARPDADAVLALLERHAGADAQREELLALARDAKKLGLADFEPAAEVEAPSDLGAPQPAAPVSPGEDATPEPVEE